MTGLSLRTRLTAWYTLGLGTTLLVFGVVVNQAFVGTLRREFDERVASAAGVVQFAVRDAVHDLGPEAAADRLLRQLRFIDVSVAIRAVASDGRDTWFAGSDSVLAAAGAVGPCQAHGVERQRLGPVYYRLLVQCLTTDGGTPALAIIVGVPERELMDETTRIRRLIALALLAGLALTTLGGHWLSGKALAPIRRMAGQVQRIGSENLDDRLPVYPGAGEIAILSRIVNELFDRLKSTVARERQFLANAAHALRTPVSVLRNEASDVARRPDLPGPVRESLEELEGLASHLGRTVEYLLSLARRDAGGEAMPLERLYLDDVVSGTVTRLGRVAERRRIQVVWSELSETSVLANSQVVDQLVQILLENAFQYAPAGSTVRVGVSPVDGGGQLVVEDAGPGFSSDDLAVLFQPFVRGTAARQTGAPGSGLGLAVARWLVETCHGSITAEHVEPHGARFIARFPSPTS